MNTLIEKATAALSLVIDPELRKPITELDMVGDIQGTEDQFTVEIKLTVSHCPQATQIEQRVREELAKAFPQATATVLLSLIHTDAADE
mgnify:CR=1 FL=1